MRPCSHKLGFLPLFCLALSGCVGEGSLFKHKQALTGDYFLARGTDGYNERYLGLKNKEADIPIRVDQIGWNQDYILFTSADCPKEWNVINVKTKDQFTISESERVQNKQFENIAIAAPEVAWCGYVGCRNYQ